MAKKVTKKTTTKNAKTKTTKTITKKAATPKTVSPAKQTKAMIAVAIQLKTFIKSMDTISIAMDKFCKVFGLVVPADLNLDALTSPGKVEPLQAQTTPAKNEMFDPVPITEPTNGSVAITKDQITQALQEVGATQGMPKVKQILETVKATNVSDIKVAQYEAVIGLCKPLQTQDAKPASQIDLFQ